VQGPARSAQYAVTVFSFKMSRCAVAAVQAVRDASRRTWKNSRAMRDVVLRSSSTPGSAASTRSRADGRRT
jgi:hypothetical protein